MKYFKIFILIFILFGFITFISCDKKETSKQPDIDYSNENIKVAIVIKNYGEVIVELDHENAPLTVEHFVKLVQDGSYDNTDFIRLQSNFVLQGGANCKDTSTVVGEFKANGIDNNIEHKTGVLSMARSDSYDSGSSQFFIVLSDNYQSSLDGLYTGFGKVVEGWDVIEKIQNDVDSSYFTADYYGMIMGFFKKDKYIKIEKMYIVK